MKLFVGLGNPGSKYARNRHNIGFMALDRIADDHGFGPWKSKFQAEIAEGRLGREKVLLIKPQTFMNRSGQSVGEAMRFYKLHSTDVTVFHDELDLAPGKVRVKAGGGHPFMSISARPMIGCVWASGIPDGKRWSRPMFWVTLPKPMRTGWRTYCAAWQTARAIWLTVTAESS